MVDEISIGKKELTSPSRRDLVTKAAQVAVTAPAVALLLNASTTNSFAQLIPYPCCRPPPILDDFTFGNSAEDIDAVALGNNFNPFNGMANQDDHI